MKAVKARQRKDKHRQPNFILFITDQQRADFLSCYGHTLLRTPNIDAIASRGTRFNRCYVASPVCMANRASLMTGRMPSVHGVRMNGIPLSQLQATFVEALRSGGYATSLIGKSHLQNMVDVAPYVRAQRAPTHQKALTGNISEARRDSDDDYDQELPHRWNSHDPLKLKTPYYGFDHVDLCTGHGDLVGGHYFQWLRKRCSDPESLRGPTHSLPHHYVCPQAWRTAVPERLYPTAYIRDRALEFLSEENPKPYFLMVSFPDPHHPFTPPGHYWDLYRPDDVQLPDSFNAADKGSAAAQWARNFRHDHPDVIRGYGAFAATEQETREAIALTCGMIAMIDDAIGAIMARLAERSDCNDTVVIFTSDHGDFLGDYGLLLKGPLHLQSVIRVPLIWSDYAHPQDSKQSNALASTIDIAATILDRAAIRTYNGLQGRSLLPVLEKQPGRTWTLVEEDGQDAQFGFESPPRIRSLISASHRLTIYDVVSRNELVDLKNDPNELNNLWDQTQSSKLKCELLEMLARAELEYAERSPMPRYLA
jgi:arylsulfatase A-like enzyme